MYVKKLELILDLILGISKLKHDKRPRASPFKPNDRVLIVTAHPDDECMFFGPTLCHLADRDIQAKVLCLSTGNFYGKGKGLS